MNTATTAFGHLIGRTRVDLSGSSTIGSAAEERERLEGEARNDDAAGGVRFDGSGEAATGARPSPLASRRAAIAHALRALGEDEVGRLLDEVASRPSASRLALRVYAGLLAAAPSAEAVDTSDELFGIAEQEVAHFAWLRCAAEELEHDVPCARARLGHCLEAVLAAERAENDCWSLLAQVAEQLGRDDLVVRFQRAASVEARRLSGLRAWAGATLRHNLEVLDERTG